MISAHFALAVANHLWQSTAVVAIIGLLTLALRGNAARLRHQLWMIASLKFLLPFSLLVALGTHLQPGTPVLKPRPAVTLMLGQITEPFSRASVVTMARPAMAELSRLPARPKTSNVWSVVLFLWVCGSMTFVFAWFRKWLSIRNAVKSAEHVGAVGKTRIVSSQTLREPGVFGILQPVLILPAGIRKRLSSQQLEAVIDHEVTHVRRRDNLTMTFHMFVEATFWFHPLVWWIGRRLVEERELACDEAVLQSGNEPEAYAEGILTVLQSVSGIAPAVCCGRNGR